MNTLKIIPAKTDADIQEIALLAKEIWREHFTDIIGKPQVEYMVEKFQSYPALKQQISEGYEYFQLLDDGVLAGYIGIHEEEDALFLSKLYIHKDYRGQHFSSQALRFLINLCRKRGLTKIWLTCNKDNLNTLNIYHHMGFATVREQKADIGNGFFMDDYILELNVAR